MCRGDVVGDHGGGIWVMVVFGGVGVHWGLVEIRIIGERERYLRVGWSVRSGRLYVMVLVVCLGSFEF